MTFLDKYTIDQFQIIGFGQGDMFIASGGQGATADFVHTYYSQGNTGQISVGWKHVVFYRSKKAVVPYGRVFIRRRKDITK